jgi:hypothetical protein
MALTTPTAGVAAIVFLYIRILDRPADLTAGIAIVTTFVILSILAIVAMSIWLAYRLTLRRRGPRTRLVPDGASENPNSVHMLAGYGFRIFVVLIGLVVFELLLIVLFATFTFPRGLSGSEAMDARAAWVTQLKDIGQIFLLTPIFPLLGAVIGYIFGRQERTAESNGG